LHLRMLPPRRLDDILRCGRGMALLLWHTHELLIMV
jgi:hypothetical protein